MVTNQYIVYDSIYVKFKNRKNVNMAIEIITMVPYGILEVQGDFWSDENVLYLILNGCYTDA